MDDERGEAVPDVRLVLDAVGLGQQRGQADLSFEPGAAVDDARRPLPQTEGVGQDGRLLDLAVEEDPLVGHEDVVEDRRTLRASSGAR